MIVVDLGKCTGCMRCEVACSFFRTGRIGSRLSRVKVVHIYEKGIDGPVFCVQCIERHCMKCPAEAMSVGELGQIVVSPTLCTLCGACEKLCPIGAVEIFEGVVYVCDLCGGRMKCMEACTEKAISFTDDMNHESLSRGEIMNPTQKRYTYMENLGEELKKRWRRIHA